MLNRNLVYQADSTMTALNLCVPCSLLLLAFTVTVANAQGSASASPAAQAAQASPISGALDSSFAGLGIEPSNLFSFTGGSTANSLSVNLLQNLADYSGKPPHLRIGGNTGDNMIYDTSMVDFSVSKNPSSTGQGAVASDLYLFGPKYWEALDRFPINTPITFGLNMAYEAGDFKDRIVAEAEAAVKGLTNAQLVSFEIGNEPDLWLANGFRTGTWDGAEYTKEWLGRAATVWQQVLKPAGLSSAFFEPAATASTIETTFEIDLLVQDGIRNGTNGSGSFIAGWNQHDYFYFVSVTKYGL
jgi:hypothetical protein